MVKTHRPKIVNTALTMNMRFKSLYLNNWWEFFNGSGMWLEDLQLVISSSGQLGPRYKQWADRTANVWIGVLILKG